MSTQPPAPPPFPAPTPGTPGSAYPGAGSAAAHTNGQAIASLVTAIAGGVLGMICCLPAPIGGIVAVVLGRSARGSIRRSGGIETGEGLATAGEILGWILVVLGVFGLLAFVSLIVVGNQTKNVLCNISSGLSSPPP
jgi:hypothetical protein